MDMTNSIMSISELLNAKFWMRRRAEQAKRDPKAMDEIEDPAKPVDWCAIARGEPATSEAAYRDIRSAKDELILSDPNVLELYEMIQDVRYFHKEYFTLTMAQEATGSVWKINLVSPFLKTKMTDVRASFNHTDTADMLKLGTILAGEQAASSTVKWGVNGEAKRIYIW